MIHTWVYTCVSMVYLDLLCMSLSIYTFIYNERRVIDAYWIDKHLI